MIFEYYNAYLLYLGHRIRYLISNNLIIKKIYIRLEDIDDMDLHICAEEVENGYIYSYEINDGIFFDEFKSLRKLLDFVNNMYYDKVVSDYVATPIKRNAILSMQKSFRHLIPNRTESLEHKICCVCYETCFRKTPCKHILCYLCFRKLPKVSCCEDINCLVVKCPICRTELDIHH